MSHNQYKFVYLHNNSTIEADITIPFEESVEELAHVLILKNNLPIFVEEDLIQHVSKFINESSLQYCNEQTTELIDNAKNNKINIEEMTKEWEKLMKEEMAEYGERRCASDEELFATAYHKMVHSPALETMLQLEHMYSKTVRTKTEEKNRCIQNLSERQTEEMNQAVDRLEQDMTESKINELVARHYEAHSLLKVKLTSELDTIKEAQRREYREWLMQMLEQNQATRSLPTPNSPLTPHPPQPMIYSSIGDRSVITTPILEESFTIHLGSQLKQMHNIRILSANVMELCAVEDNDQSSEPKPQLLQTALALYSNDLSGLVLMTDNKIGSRLTQDFQEICQRTTEFHFPHIDDQLDKISVTAQQYLKSQTKENSNRNTNSELLQAGDFYMTRHSNLAQVHVIFHMVSDDSLRGSDINSRHPVVLGLRNILKTACSNDITSLTIPLLLQYEMTEEMTISWCEKRAELVFKCVKGFMIEMASWGGSDLKNLQFMLPQGISSQVFQSLTEMLPRIFKWIQAQKMMAVIEAVITY
ncbi:C12orf4 -like [Asbolus verrucosus]|uniref:C12orf4-like n=1 Tax=Asbolus verrucosus TaxID=1661398 RepID=A0A482VB26_ASBVE|nr:C12orf4 -like [Asbolus verrucosus]